MPLEYVYDLWFHPEGAGWGGREKRGSFGIREAAIAATEHPDPADWQSSGSRDWILNDPIIDAAGREASWWTITREYKREPEPTLTGKLITLRLVQHGETEIQVDSGLYATAKADGKLDHLLDSVISDMETDTTVIEPDGVVVAPYGGTA